MASETFEKNVLAILDRLLKAAEKAGADAADAVVFDSAALSVDCRLGELEDVGREESRDVGLRVLVGRRQACVSGTETRPEALDLLAERGVAMAKVAPEDPYCGLAEKTVSAVDAAVLDLDDAVTLDVDTLFTAAKRAEDAARAPEGITNSEGGSAGWSRTTIALATTDGFRGVYTASGHSISACVLAGTGTAMERDYDYATARHHADLPAPEDIGARAAERTLKRLNPRRVSSAKVPVVYHPRVGNSLLSHFAGAINGQAVARRTSFLTNMMNTRIFAPGIRVIDDPTRPRGLRSRPFDAEGAAALPLDLIADGTLGAWLLDTSAARQLGLESNGRASRGASAPPSPGATNLYMEAGEATPETLIREIESGFYVMDLIGMGVNGVTGDYSRGAAGFWIEKGEITYPVSELTIAGNLKEIYANLTPASDLEFRYGTNVPTLRIEGMTLAGS